MLVVSKSRPLPCEEPLNTLYPAQWVYMERWLGEAHSSYYCAPIQQQSSVDLNHGLTVQTMSRSPSSTEKDIVPEAYFACW